MNLQDIDHQVLVSLSEDVGAGDISALLIDPDHVSHAQIKSREWAVVCGVEWANSVYRQLDSRVELQWLVKDGDEVEADQIWVKLNGTSRSLLTGERSALNWLQTLSGTATQVKKYIDALASTKVQLLDTRKTIPGLRAAQKYAVRCAGGNNHRMGLFDAYLIKENHLISSGSITQAVQQARFLNPQKILEVEVETLAQLQEALDCGVDIVLLDNFDLEQIKQAVKINQGRCKLEVSGGITLENIRSMASTGIDYISVGALTKHIRAIDLSMRFC